MSAFLMFIRVGIEEWKPYGPVYKTLGAAVNEANESIGAVAAVTARLDRVVVMEVSGVDAVPSFTYRYGAKR